MFLWLWQGWVWLPWSSTVGGGNEASAHRQIPGCSATYSAFSKWLKSTLDTHALFGDEVIIKSRKTLTAGAHRYLFLQKPRATAYMSLPHAWSVRVTRKCLFCLQLQHILLMENESPSANWSCFEYRLRDFLTKLKAYFFQTGLKVSLILCQKNKKP